MTEYWKNKYTVKFENPTIDTPVGTMFTVTGMQGNQFELTAIDESKGYTPVVIELGALLFGFTSSSSNTFQQSFTPSCSLLLDQISEYVRKNK